MIPTLEQIRPSHVASFRWVTFDRRSFPFVWHFHPEIELTLIVSGAGRRFVGDHVGTYRAGDLVLLGANLPHTWQSAPRPSGQRHVSLVCQFSRECLGSGFFDLPELRQVDRLLGRARRGLQVTGRTRRRVMAAIRGIDRREPLRQMITLLQVLDLLSRSRDLRPLASSGYVTPRPDEGDRRITPLCRHIEKNLTQPLHQADVAARLGMDPAAFSRFFRKATGRTFVDHLHELRVGRACQLLIETDLPITDIAYRSGFMNLSNFNRRFRQRHRCTPREYRRLYRQD